MIIHLKIWRQDNRQVAGGFQDYTLDDVSPDMSFLEMLDLLNERLIKNGERVIEFDHDCREGICGQCGVMINGRAHGPLRQVTTCQLHMRSFRDGETIYVEPFRAAATCKNSSAALFTAAKISHLALLPQGKQEAVKRAKTMIAQMNQEGFGHCTNTEACEVECPQQISVLQIARMNWEFNRGLF